MRIDLTCSKKFRAHISDERSGALPRGTALYGDSVGGATADYLLALVVVRALVTP